MGSVSTTSISFGVIGDWRCCLGHDLPAASTALQRLDQFHDPATVAGRPQRGSFIPAESAGLAGLRAVVEHSLRTYCTAVKPGPAVTLDVDAHLVEASKQSALRTYEGIRGHQPLLVSRAETSLVLADDFATATSQPAGGSRNWWTPHSPPCHTDQPTIPGR